MWFFFLILNKLGLTLHLELHLRNLKSEYVKRLTTLIVLGDLLGANMLKSLF